MLWDREFWPHFVSEEIEAYVTYLLKTTQLKETGEIWTEIWVLPQFVTLTQHFGTCGYNFPCALVFEGLAIWPKIFLNNPLSTSWLSVVPEASKNSLVF